MHAKPIENAVQATWSGAAASAVLLVILGHLFWNDTAPLLEIRLSPEEAFLRYYLLPALVGGLAGSVIGWGIWSAVKCQPPSSLNLWRGLWAAGLGALGGALAPKALALVLALYERVCWGSEETRLTWFRNDLEKLVAYPVIGCAMVCACAGWATFAPGGKHSFVRSLSVIFLSSTVLWTVVAWMRLTPGCYRAIEPSAFQPAELLARLGPPNMAALLITAIRVRGSTAPLNEPDRGLGTLTPDAG